jgi:prepilin-type N-terminal cleavage/methylation domain-containing protein
MKKRIFKIFNNGFTLIELLAVIVVLSVILVIAIPKIGNVMDEPRKLKSPIPSRTVKNTAINGETICRYHGIKVRG